MPSNTLIFLFCSAAYCKTKIKTRLRLKQLIFCLHYARKISKICLLFAKIPFLYHIIYLSLFNFLFYNFILNALVAFSTASTITPTSANIATHILAIPSAPSTRQIAFIANAKIMFSLTISSVLFDIFIANAIFAGS